MALPVLTVFNAPYGIDETQTRFFLRGKVVWTAQTYATGGLLPVYTSFLDASGASVLPSILTSSVIGVNPDEMLVFSESGSGFIYTYVRSTGKISIWVTNTTGNNLEELAAGALPAGVIADVVRFIASWPKQ